MSRRIIFVYNDKKYDDVNEVIEMYKKFIYRDDEFRKKYNYKGCHIIDSKGCLWDDQKLLAIGASKKRRVANLGIFKSNSRELWEQVYKDVLDVKYQKNTRNFSRIVTGNKCNALIPPIYLIARQRGGPSYKDVDVIGSNKDDIAFMPISKGFSMQGLSSFALGPIIGEGLCLVNAAFSKIICTFHIEGGGSFDLTKPNFWKRGVAKRVIKHVSGNKIKVDGKNYNTQEWLHSNEGLWLEEWNKWRMHVALCSVGDFHWDSLSPKESGDVICYKNKNKYLSFVEWKKECYIRPAYQLIPHTPEYKFIKKVWLEDRRPIGLVHPMGQTQKEPYTKEMIKSMFDSDTEMSCMPFVVIGSLLGVPIY